MPRHISELLPVKIDSTSNGEYAPVPVGTNLRRARVVAAARIEDNARRTGQTRRDFLASLCGVATTLATFNQAFAHRGNLGGYFQLAVDSHLDSAAAEATLSGDEFIFDVQTHMVDPKGCLLYTSPSPRDGLLSRMPSSA